MSKTEQKLSVIYGDFGVEIPTKDKEAARPSGSILEQDRPARSACQKTSDIESTDFLVDEELDKENIPFYKGLHGENTCYVVQREKPFHRTIAYMFAEGKKAIEICEITGYSPFAISNLQKQPWFERTVLEMVEAHGGNRVQSFLDQKVMPALETLADVMEDEETSSRDKISAANSILDRKFGKPNQGITLEHRVDPKDMSDDELARIARSSGTRTATTTSGS